MLWFKCAILYKNCCPLFGREVPVSLLILQVWRGWIQAVSHQMSDVTLYFVDEILGSWMLSSVESIWLVICSLGLNLSQQLTVKTNATVEKSVDQSPSMGQIEYTSFNVLFIFTIRNCFVSGSEITGIAQHFSWNCSEIC